MLKGLEQKLLTDKTTPLTSTDPQDSLIFNAT